MHAGWRRRNAAPRCPHGPRGLSRPLGLLLSSFYVRLSRNPNVALTRTGPRWTRPRAGPSLRYRGGQRLPCSGGRFRPRRTWTPKRGIGKGVEFHAEARCRTGDWV